MKAWVRAQRACMQMLMPMLVLLMAAPLGESATDMKDAAVLNLLRKAQPQDVIMHPYPYIVIKDAWPKPLYDRLSREFPSIKAITSGPGIPGAGVGARTVPADRREKDCVSEPCAACVRVDSFAPCVRLHLENPSGAAVQQASLTGVRVGAAEACACKRADGHFCHTLLETPG